MGDPSATGVLRLSSVCRRNQGTYPSSEAAARRLSRNMGSCCSTETRSGEKKPEDTVGQPTTDAKGDVKPTETVKIIVEQVDENPKELKPGEKSGVVKHSDDGAAEEIVRKEDVAKAGVQPDDIEAKESADATSEPVTSAGPESVDNEKDDIRIEDAAAAASSQVKPEEVKACEEEQPVDKKIDPQADVQLPGTVEIKPNKESVKSVSPDDVHVFSPSEGKQDGEADGSQEVNESEDVTPEEPKETPDEYPDRVTTTEKSSCEEAKQVAVETENDTAAVGANSETAKQADSIAKDFVAPLEAAVIANVIDKKLSETSSDIEKESLERGEVNA